MFRAFPVISVHLQYHRLFPSRRRGAFHYIDLTSLALQHFRSIICALKAQAKILSYPGRSGYPGCNADAMSEYQLTCLRAVITSRGVCPFLTHSFFSFHLPPSTFHHSSHHTARRSRSLRPFNY